MSDDYLWDSAAALPPGDRIGQDVAKLERMLAPLRVPLAPPPLVSTASSAISALSASSAFPAVSARFVAAAVALAAAIVLMVAATFRQDGEPSVAWAVATLDGRPRIESRAGSSTLDGIGQLAVGDTLTTDGDSRARIDVSTIGQVTIEPQSRVRLIGTRAGRHELALARGTLRAFITAPPGQFVVDTPSSTATDLGCVYSLHVDEDGSGMLSVTAGWVAFEYRGRESFVPAGASARTDPATGPGTPHYDDAEMIGALERFDAGLDRGRALADVITRARPKDAMTLWHLIPRVDRGQRIMVIAALDTLVPMPISVTTDAVENLNRTALDLWWNALGLDTATWWRKWERAFPGTR